MKGLIISPDFYNDRGGLEQQIRALNHYLHFDILSHQRGQSFYFSSSILDIAYCNRFIRNGKYETILVMCNDSRLENIIKMIKDIEAYKILSISTDPRLFAERTEISKIDLNLFSLIRVQLKQYANSYKNTVVIPNMLLTFPKEIHHNDILVTSVNMPTENKALDILENAMKYVDIPLYTYGNFKLHGDNIYSFPFTDDKNEIYNNKLAYISTSFYEGMSNSVLEALSFNLPVIARRNCYGANFGASLVYDTEAELIECLQKTKTLTCQYDISVHTPEKIIPLWKDILRPPTTAKCA